MLGITCLESSSAEKDLGILVGFKLDVPIQRWEHQVSDVPLLSRRLAIFLAALGQVSLGTCLSISEDTRRVLHSVLDSSEQER